MQEAQETGVPAPGQGDLLETGTRSSMCLGNPGTEEPGELQSVRHTSRTGQSDCTTTTVYHKCLPGEEGGRLKLPGLVSFSYLGRHVVGFCHCLLLLFFAFLEPLAIFTDYLK